MKSDLKNLQGIQGVKYEEPKIVSYLLAGIISFIILIVFMVFMSISINNKLNSLENSIQTQILNMKTDFGNQIKAIPTAVTSVEVK